MKELDWYKVEIWFRMPGFLGCKYYNVIADNESEALSKARCEMRENKNHELLLKQDKVTLVMSGFII